MAKREDPFMLANYRFMSPKKRGIVDKFIAKLDDTCREFATKRYVENKTVAQVAEEMGYTERAVYAFRNRIISLWDLYSDGKRDKYEYHRQRIIKAVKRRGVIRHWRLKKNLNLRRSGLSETEFMDLLNRLVAEGRVIRYYSTPGKKGGAPGTIYEYSAK